MIRTVANSDSFINALDRNGVKIHIGEQVLFKNYDDFKEGIVCAFSDKFRYVYIIHRDVLFKRRSSNVVIINNLRKWKHSYR